MTIIQESSVKLSAQTSGEILLVYICTRTNPELMISVGGTAITNFKKDFTVGDQTITIDFITMNCVEKQLYQAYIPHNGSTVRIHIQRNEHGDFKIMGDNVCPPEYLPLEAEFDAAIKNY